MGITATLLAFGLFVVPVQSVFQPPEPILYILCETVEDRDRVIQATEEPRGYAFRGCAAVYPPISVSALHSAGVNMVFDPPVQDYDGDTVQGVTITVPNGTERYGIIWLPQDTNA